MGMECSNGLVRATCCGWSLRGHSRAPVFAYGYQFKFQKRAMILRKLNQIRAC